MDIKEVYKPVDGYEGIYEVSNLGNIRTLERPIYRKCGRLHYRQKSKQLKKSLFSNGYYFISMHKPNSLPEVRTIHSIVSKAFIPNPENKPCVNHKDGNKLNNNLDNLEWVTHSENIYHAWNVLNGVKGLRGVNLKTGDEIIYNNVAEAVEDGFDQGSISLACNNKIKTHKGHSFEYI